MASNAAGFFLNLSNFHPNYYFQTNEDDGLIDLGLSLRTLQPNPYQPTGNLASFEEYGRLMELPHQLSHQNMSSSISGFQTSTVRENGDDETEGAVQSKERWAYVKVNMDGVIVGRKVCVIDHAGYSSLALQLEDMFGRQTVSGVQLFQAGSEFSLFYKDREENWRAVGDVPWKEFVDCVKRLRIVHNKY